MEGGQLGQRDALGDLDVQGPGVTSVAGGPLYEETQFGVALGLALVGVAPAQAGAGSAGQPIEAVRTALLVRLASALLAVAVGSAVQPPADRTRRARRGQGLFGLASHLTHSNNRIR